MSAIEKIRRFAAHHGAGADIGTTISAAEAANIVAELDRLRAVAGEIGESLYYYPPAGPDKVDLGLMRKIATGEIKPAYEFAPKDWRDGSIAILLHRAAEELAFLRPIVGSVSSGELRQQAKKS